MANSQSADGERRVRRRRRSYSELEGEKLYKSRGKEKVTLEPDISEVRRIRIDRLEAGSTSRRSSETPKMTSESHATLPSLKSASSHRRRKEHRRSTEETKHSRRRKSTPKDESTTTYVYGKPADRSQSSRITISETRRLGRDGESSESEEERATQSEPVVEKPKRSKIRVVYITEESKPKHKERRSRAEKVVGDQTRHIEESGSRSRAHESRRKPATYAPPTSPPSRSASTRHLPTQTRPDLKRSNTTSSHVPSHKDSYTPSISNTNSTSRRSSWMGSFFGSAVQHHHEPERLVECLTCLSDDIPRSKSAKLKCGHRMCHSCLKRIFRLSVTDPQHMPPKCCTADHIPLKHVERLFDNNFKRKWNVKFQEYSTKNRIYCPARRCGEWIKPGSIHKEDGKKYGKCSRCKTKVCCLCNGKWHGTKDCPKDEETNRLLEAAKQAGWQRCYNCRTMVELKEGCNHMTCRCTAEFCMICGLKWKSCNCPWFNYDAVEADRLEHMQVPEEVQIPQAREQREQRQHRLRRPRPNNYHDEMNERRRQERTDEEMARRLQGVDIEDEDDDYQGGIGDIHGVGNNAGHFMNQDYLRAAQDILTGPFNQATAAANYVMGVAQARGVPQPQGAGRPRMADRYPVAPPAAAPGSPPILRRHTMREAAYNSAQSTRASERVVPRRTRTDYQSEAAVHAPVGRAHQRSSAGRTVRPSVLAGLGGSGRGSNRVNAWRTHVQPGVTPPEGVMSV